MLDIAVADAGDMHQAVLMDADVHEYAEVYDVAHRTGEHHAGLEILQVQHIRAQNGLGQLVARIAARLAQLLCDVPQRRHTDAAELRGPFRTKGFQTLRKLRDPARGNILQRVAAERQELLRGMVGFRMDAGTVEHLRALRHAQEAGCLLVGFLPELRHLQHLFARGKGTVFLPIGYDVFCRGRIQSGDAPQQGGGGRIQIHADGVDAVLDHAAQSLVQPFFRHVMLILPHTDGLGVDFDQLGQRILQAARDGDGTAQIYVVLGELLGRKGGGRIDRGAGLRDDHIRHALYAPQKLADGCFRLAGGCAIADGNMSHAVLFNEPLQRDDGFLPLGLGEGGIDHSGVQHLARRVHHGDLAAVAVAGVQPHRHMTAHRRLHQKWAQVQREIANRALVGLVRQGAAQFALHTGRDQAVIGVLGSGADEGCRPAARDKHRPAHADKRLLPVHLHAGLQKSLAFAAVYGKHLMPLQLGKRLGKVIIGLVDGGLLLLALDGLRMHDGLPLHETAQRLADGGIVGDFLRDDIGGAGQCVGGRFHALFRADIRLCQLLRLGQIACL